MRGIIKFKNGTSHIIWIKLIFIAMSFLIVGCMTANNIINKDKKQQTFHLFHFYQVSVAGEL